MTHELKIKKEYFNEVIKGNKTFEVRKNDRNFKRVDNAILKEYENGEYTGREVWIKIRYVLSDFIGLSDGYVAFSIRILKVKESDNK